MSVRGGRRRSLRRPLVIAGGYAIAAAAMAWAVWLARDSTLGQRPTALRWGFVAAAVAADVATYACQALRWRLLLRGAGRLSWFAAARAIYIGLFVSEVLPMRPGEGVRAWLAARELHTPIAAVVPSIVVERFFDAVLLAVSVGVATMLVPMPASFVAAGRTLGAGVVAAAIALGFAIVRGKPIERDGAQESRIRSTLRDLAGGIREIGLARTTLAAFVLSCLLLAGQILAFWLAMRASGIDRSLALAAGVLTLVHLGTAVPATPGNAGTFQVFVILGLMLFGVEGGAAAAFSIAGFVILTAPLWLLGGLAMGLAASQLPVGSRLNLEP